MTLPTVEQMMDALAPVVFWSSASAATHELIRFSYTREEFAEQPANSLEVVFRRLASSERIGYRFRGVKLESFPGMEAADEVEVIVQNKYVVQHEAPRALEIRVRTIDGSEEVHFWAGYVEAI